MNRNNILVGIFVTVGILLFGAVLFLIGNQHRAFRKHLEFYAEFSNLEGVTKGAKVRVSGMDAGQVTDIRIPSKPSEKFRVRVQVDDRLHGLIRDDSVVSIETAGIVGDEFLLIHTGTDDSPEAPNDAMLAGKEPFEIGKMLEKANGLLTQVGGTITDVQGKLDTALAAVTTTVNNTNGVVTDIRHGKGTAGMLLEDQATANQVKQILGNAQQATQNVNTATVKVNDLLSDFQSRHLFAQAQQTLNNANGAAIQLKGASQQLNTTLGQAFAEDQYGNTAGANLQQSLSNMNAASGNLTDDTEALKHEFFFKGFFKDRGYDNLDALPESQYRQGTLFKKLTENRAWLSASSLFTTDRSGSEILSPSGRKELDDAVGQMHDLYTDPLIIEGYAQAGDPGQQLVASRKRATMVRAYLEIRFHVPPKNIGVIALSSTPPSASGKTAWDGVCLVDLSHRDKK